MLIEVLDQPRGYEIAASEATLSGAVDHFEVDSSGASEINARTLRAKVVEVELSGAGVAEVWVLDKRRAWVIVIMPGKLFAARAPEQLCSQRHDRRDRIIPYPRL